ncbi:hypothetical protein J6590_057551 [Homalodisca vitripennis]|nr:hypothetical protein J6590_057551 [Homalodisca vitripennis]
MKPSRGKIPQRLVVNDRPQFPVIRVHVRVWVRWESESYRAEWVRLSLDIPSSAGSKGCTSPRQHQKGHTAQQCVKVFRPATTATTPTHQDVTGCSWNDSFSRCGEYHCSVGQLRSVCRTSLLSWATPECM